MALRFFLISLCLLWASAAQAEDSPESPRASALMREIRCVVCNAQSIADSNAPLAADLRREITTRVEAGESDSAIKTSLRGRYGDQVLLEPPLRTDTAPLWAAPILLLLLAIISSWHLLRKRRRA